MKAGYCYREWISGLLLLGFALILVSNIVHSQNPAPGDMLWHTYWQSHDKWRGDHGNAIDVVDGSIYIAGTTYGPWDSTKHHDGTPVTIKRQWLGGRDGLVMKADTSGHLEWVTFLGGWFDEDECLDIEVVDQGPHAGIYVCGTSAIWRDDAGINPAIVPKHDHYAWGGMDAFVARLTLDGQITWLTFLGGQSIDVASSIYVDEALGHIYLGGHSEADWTLDWYQAAPISPFAGPGLVDAFVAKLDVDGNHHWHTFMGASLPKQWNMDINLPVGIGIDANKNVFVCGSSNASFGTPIPGFEYNTGSDGFVAKLDSSGNRIWHIFAGSAPGAVIPHDRCNDLVVNSAGDLYVTGFTWGDWNAISWGSPVVSYGSNEREDLVVMKLSGSGVPQWHTILGSWERETGEDITLDTDGNIFVTGVGGRTWGNPVLPAQLGANVIATRLDDSGHITWNAFLGSWDAVNGLGVDVQEEMVYLTGVAKAPFACVGPAIHDHLYEYPPPPDSRDLFITRMNTESSVISPQTFSIEAVQGDTVTLAGSLFDPCNKLTSFSVSLGLLSDNGDGSWTWILNTSGLVPGQYEISFTADDGQGWTPSQEVSLQVLPPNQPPVLFPDDDLVTVKIGDTAYMNGTVYDPDGDEVSLGWYPGTAVKNQDSSWNWWLNTEGMEIGIYGVTLEADDGRGGITLAGFQLRIERVPTAEEINNRIVEALIWLAGEQRDDGSWGGEPYYPVIEINEPVEATGFALTKFSEYAYELGFDSPFNAYYPYSQNVVDGYNYLFSQVKTPPSGPGLMMIETAPPPTYPFENTSAGLMAIASSRLPGRVIDFPSNPLVHGLTYLELANELTLYLTNMQDSDPASPSFGGWGDSRASGYVAYSLMFAETFGVAIPLTVKSNINSWIDYIQNDVSGGAGFWNPDQMVNMANTAHLLVQMAFAGDQPENSRTAFALDYITDLWNDQSSDPQWVEQNIELLYTLMKALMSLSMETVDVDSEHHNWFEEFATQLLFFSIRSEEGYWIFGWGGDRLFNTCWALLTLERSYPVQLNQPPVLTVLTDPVSVDESVIAINSGSVGDPDGDPVALSASIGSVVNNGDGTWSWSSGTSDGPSHTSVMITADDGRGGSAEASFDLIVNNVPPLINYLTLPPEPVSMEGQPVDINVGWSDQADVYDAPFTCIFDFGDGTRDTILSSTFSIGIPHFYNQPGVYEVSVTILDKDGGETNATASEYAVLYNAEEGFVTGGGWIISPEGAYLPGPTLTGKANFGFVSKYKKGQSTPDGNTEFQFRAADLNFHSGNYDWLVIAGPKVMLKGTGTINGVGSFGFILSAIDAGLTPSIDIDLFRMQIWDKNNGDVTVYDNKLGETDPNADPSTAISGGNIKIHKKEVNEFEREGAVRSDDSHPVVSGVKIFPNPFSEITSIRYIVGTSAHVELKIFSLVGKEVACLGDEVQEVGEQCKYWAPDGLETGVYLFKLKAGDLIYSGKMILSR